MNQPLTQVVKQLHTITKHVTQWRETVEGNGHRYYEDESPKELNITR